MSSTFDRMREEHIKARLLRNLGQRRRDRVSAADMAEASRHGRLLRSHIDPETPLPDVPLHKRGFGVMDKDAPVR
jgi:hypothetical protein